MRSKLALALPLLCAALSLRLPAQNLVTDLEPGYLPVTVTGGPQALVTVGSQVFFTATHQDFGTELWVFDPRVGTPRMVLDIAPGRAASAPGQCTAWNGRLFFTANRSGLGQELWVSDGTAAGTRLVADVEPGASSSSPTVLVPTPAGLYFTAFTSATGREPWITDGTTAGTRLLRDINPGAGSGVLNQPGSAALHGGRVYFQGLEPATGGELWSTDGTSAGTALVVDAVPGGVGLAPAGLVSSNAGLFFRTNDPLAPGRPWVSDGTAAGTRAVQPATGELLGLNSGPVSVGTQVVFSAYDRVTGFRMWRSDGTGTGTTPCSAVDTFGAPVTLGSVAVFFTSNLLQRTLWVVPAGTGAATPIQTWNLASTAVPLEAQAVVGGRLWFSLDVQGSGVEPWVSDGTSAGTQQVADLVPGSEGSYARSFAAYPGLRNHTLFVAGNRQRQDELWSSDGTPAGTRLVGSVVFPLPGSSQPNGLARCGDHVLFVAAPNATGQEPHSARPGSGAALLADIAPGNRSSNAQIVGTAGERALVQGLTDGGGTRTVLGTDGTPAGTTVLLPPAQGYGLVPLASLESRTVFLVWSGRLSLWSSDGTTAGTTALQDFGTSYTVPGGNVPYGAQIGPDALFTLYQIGAGQPPRLLLARTRDGGLRYESLWEASPTSTSLFFGLWSTGRSALARVLLSPNFTFLFTDGTAAGTRPVTVTLPGGPIGTVGNRFLLTSRPTTTSATLYVTDAGVQAFEELVTFQGATTSFQPQAFPFRDAAGRDLAILQGFDPATGNEPWITDGTPQGTRLLADLSPGTASSEPREFRVIGSRVVFSAYTLAHGREAFVTDGSAAGTRMLFDLAPGTAESEPREFTRVRTTVYFSAYHPLTGRELYAMPLLATGASLVESVGQGCAGSAGVPVLGAVGEPARGNARFALTVADARPGAPAAVFLGVGDARLAFGTCTLRVLPLASLPLAIGASGGATLALPIPADPSLRGLEFSAQAAIADPAGASLGTALTQALRMMVGD